MKLLHCTRCGDIRALCGEWSTCWCGHSRGRYLNEQEAEVEGRDALVLGVSNPSLAAAVDRELDDWNDLTRKSRGHRIDAFVVPWDCLHVKRRPGPADEEPGSAAPAV